MDTPTPDPEVTLAWQTTNQYTLTVARSEFVEWFQSAFHDMRKVTDLDEIYNRLDRDDYKANDFLHGLATGGRWLDTGRTEMSDLREEGEDR